MSKNVGGLYVELSADNKKLNQGVDESLKKLQDAQNELKDMNNERLDNLRNSLLDANTQLRGVKVSSQMVKQSLSEFKEIFQNMKPEEMDTVFDDSINKVRELQKLIKNIEQVRIAIKQPNAFAYAFTQAQIALDAYTEKLKYMETVIGKVSPLSIDKMTNSFKNAKSKLSDFVDTLKMGFVDGAKEAIDKSLELNNNVRKVANNTKTLGDNIKDFGQKAEKGFKKGLNSLKRFALALLGIRTGFSYLITNMRSYINASDSLKAKTEGIGQALQQSLAPYAELAVAALQKVVHWVILAIAYFTTFINTIFGTKIAIGGMAKNMKNLSAGIKSAGAEAKKALAPFDELNILQEDSGSGSGGGVSPDFSGLGLDEIDTSGLDKFAELLNNLKNMAMNIFDAIKNKIVEVFNSQPIQAFVGFGISYGKFLWDYWSMIGTNLYNNIMTTWNNISDDVSIIWENIKGLWTDFWTDMTITLDKWGPTIIDDVKGIFNSIWEDAIGPFIELTAKKWADFTGILRDLWDQYGGELLDNIAETIHNIIGEFKSIWDNIINPIIKPFLENLKWLWDKHLKGMLTELGKFVLELINFALKIYNKFIAPIANWLRETLAPIWSWLSTHIIGVMGSILGEIIDVVSGILRTLRGIIEFITGVFEGDWSKAWEGIKNIFGGIFDGIVGIAKGILNRMIDTINGFVAGINRIKFDVPDWVPGIGGMQWGFNISPLQKLAKGTVATAPMVAEIGEYSGAKTNPEIVSPRDTMYDTFTQALKDFGANNTPQNSQVELTLNVKYEDGRTIIKKINTAQNEAGRTLLEV